MIISPGIIFPNDTSKVFIIAQRNWKGNYWAVLPHTNKALCYQEINEKIKKLQEHIDYLNGRLPQRKADGGKRAREKKFSIKQQVNLALKHRKTLNVALSHLEREFLFAIQ